MSRLELHADGLLDRARSGQLTPEESTRLAAHCAECSACRMEFLWIADLAPRAGPSAEDRAGAQNAVDALLGTAPQLQRPARPRGRRIAWLPAAVGVGLGLLVASAAAALYTEVRALREWVMVASARVGLEPPVERRVERKRRAARPAARAPAPAAAAEAPPPAPAQGVTLPPPAAPVEEPENAERAKLPEPQPQPVREPPPSVDALLARANAAREQARFAEAAASYAELSRLHPGARGELTARVSHGLLLLHHLGQPDAAREAFARYLAALPSGPLAEEARVGLAHSLERLGLTREERIAWEELLERHPGSLHAARARDRLARLPAP